jgi:glycosyltransferase involved in cell wall biosynthesis
MRISVIVPTIGRPAQLERTLQALLAQTLDRRLYEVIVVDDASGEPYEWLPARVRLVRRSSRGGPGGARNTGVAEASGEFIAFTDDDCIVPAEWLSSLLAAFHQFPSASAVGGPLMPSPSHLHAAPARLERWSAVDYFGRSNIDPFRDRIIRRADLSPAWGTNNLAWRAARLRALGGFLEGTSSSEDRDLAMRAGAAGHLTAFVPLVVHHNREYSWRDLWQRYVSGPLPGGGSRGIVPLILSIARLPRAFARDLRLVSQYDPSLFAAAVLRDVALSVGAARAAIAGGRDSHP